MKSFIADGQIDLDMVRDLQLKVDGISLDTRKEWRKDIPVPKLNPSMLLASLADLDADGGKGH